MPNPALSAVVLLLLLATGRAQPATVRLVGSSDSTEGRLEVYHNGTWGTVCDDYFDDVAARVVCYSLGYRNVGGFVGNRYGAGRGPIWLDNVLCRGTETNIADCWHGAWGRHNCGHAEDVSVSCVGVRLVGGASAREGRLEVYHNGSWGTVCDDYFDNATARVVCSMLGYGRAGTVAANRHGPGSGAIWLDDVRCTGTETSITECRHAGWGGHNCKHSEDVSVSCITAVGLRLAGGPSPREGRLEVYYNGTWGTVCDDDFDDATATVVCQMLGHESVGQFVGSRYGAGSGPILLDDLRCSGTEANIGDCRHRGWGRHDCNHSEDASVSCLTVRLVGGRSAREGRLEVYHAGVWGTVCDDNFDNAAARVACYSLGYGNVGRFVGNRYGKGTGTIWLDEVRCNGTETSLADCRHLGWGSHNCQHAEDVSVLCIGEVRARLAGGSSPRAGRLEVYHSGAWGTVCGDGFTDTAAKVVCYSLGFGYVGRAMNIDDYSGGNGTIWLDDVACDGTETHIGECFHGGWGVHNCVHHEDVGVSCLDESRPSSSTSTPAGSSTAASPSTSTARFEAPTQDGGHKYKYTVAIFVATFIGGLVLVGVFLFALAMVLHYRNKRRERAKDDEIRRRVTPTSNTRPPPAALAVRDKPPTSEKSSKPNHAVRLLNFSV